MKTSVAGQFAAVKCRSETYPKQCLLSTINTVVYRYKNNKHCCVHLTNLASWDLKLAGWDSMIEIFIRLRFAMLTSLPAALPTPATSSLRTDGQDPLLPPDLLVSRHCCAKESETAGDCASWPPRLQISPPSPLFPPSYGRPWNTGAWDHGWHDWKWDVYPSLGVSGDKAHYQAFWGVFKWLTWLLSSWAWLPSPLIIRQRAEIQYRMIF